MSFFWRVTLPSTSGRLVLTFGDDDDPETVHVVSSRENYNTSRSLIMGWLSLLSDNPIEVYPARVLRRFAYRLANHLDLTIKTFSELADALMKSERTDDVGCFSRSYIDGFERTPIYRVYSEWYKHGDPVLLRWLLSVLSFGKAAEFDKPELETKAFNAWQENEARLQNFSLSPIGMDNLQRVVHWLLDGVTYEAERLCPHHGPGNTAERVGTGVESKNRSMTISPSLKKFFIFGGIHDVDHNGSASLYPDLQGYYDFKTTPAVLTFVKKNYKIYRTIAMLSTDKQYIGQGIREEFYKFFKRCKIARFVSLEHQEVNQAAAQRGSLTNRIDTIDLKGASDSVLWELVNHTFPYHLYCDMASLRTSSVVYRGQEIPIRMYAPMGDPLCFPVQNVLFCAIVIASGVAQSLGLDLQTDRLPSYNIEDMFNQCFSEDLEDPHHRFVSPTIYGDDICLDNRQTPNTMRELRAYGFLVNEDKSFIGHDSFRESCGKFYSKGHDVSFIKYRKSFPSEGRIDIRRLSGLIDQANHAYELGYQNLRRFYIQHALHADVRGVRKHNGKNPILFSNEEERTFAIRFSESGREVNNHLFKMWNRDLHRREIYCLGLEPSGAEKRTTQYSQYEYLQWQARNWYNTQSVMIGWDEHCSPEPTHEDGYVYIFDRNRAQWHRYNEPAAMQVPVRADYRDVVPTMRWTASW